MFYTKPKKALLAIAIGSALLAPNLQAIEFYFGENNDIELRINSQLSIGASWLLDDPSPDTYFAGNTFGGVPGTGFGSATDDGTLNFKGGETFSQVFKGFTEFNLSKDNYGFFARSKFWYDYELDKGDRPHGNSANGYAAGEPLSDEGFSDFAKFSGIELLDAYAYVTFDWGNVPINLRLGRQVVNWGESIFIQGGLNAINPIDVSAVRRPGVELKEALLPVGMFYAQAGLTENLSIEGFYQYEWEKTQIDGCGTLFSTSDFVADGCNWVTVGPNDITSLQAGFAAKREADVEPDDGGQYGIALRYFVESIDTELGFYAMNIHSRLPNLTAIRSGWRAYTSTPFFPHSTVAGVNAAFPALQDTVNTQLGGDPTLLPEDLQQTYGLGVLFSTLGVDTREETDALNPGYRVEYLEDLKIYGVSFATNIGGFSVSGEISYKPDTPLQINGAYLVSTALQEDTNGNIYPLFNRFGEPGQPVEGYDFADQTQIQINALKFYERVLGASRLTLIGEVGMTVLDGVDDLNAQGFYHGRDPLFGLSLENTNVPGLSIDQGAGFDGFITETSWGYRARAVLDYPNVFAGVSLKPTIAFAHDVDGVSGTQFQEGRKSWGLSLEALYLQKYSATVSYTGFSGGSHSVLAEKDFVSLSFGVAF